LAAPLRLLVTSVGSLVGHAVLASLAGLRDRVRVIGTNSVAGATGSTACDRVHLVPPTADTDAYLDAHARIVATERPDLILPTRDAELTVLPRLLERFRDPPVYLGSAPAAAAVTTDKRQTWRFAVDAGLPFARTAVAPDEVRALARQCGYPLLAKPWTGFASRGVFVVRDDDERERVLALGTHLFQEYLEPDQARSSRPALPLCDVRPERNTVAVVNAGPDGRVRARLACGGAVVAGRLAARHRLDDTGVVAVAEVWAAALAPLGYAGPLNVQGRYDPAGRFLPFELNARLAGGARARALLGFDDLAILLDAYGFPIGNATVVPAAGRVVVMPRSRLVAATAIGSPRGARADHGAETGDCRPHALRATQGTVSAPLRVLLTSVGSLSGYGALACLDGLRDRVRVIGTNAVAEAVPNFLCDTTYLVPPTADAEAYLAAHARIVAAERPDVVIPTRDEELEVLPRLRDLLPGGERPVYPGSSAAVARIAGDKLETWRFAQAHGLPCAVSASTPDEIAALVRRFGYPLIAKPRRGFGSRGVYIVRDGEEAARVSALGGYLFQEYVGVPDDLDARTRLNRIALPLFEAPVVRNLVAMLIAGPDGVPVAVKGEISILEAGKAIGSCDSDEPAVIAAAEAWAAALRPLGFAGPLNVQGNLRADGSYALYEMALRINGGGPTRLLHGFNDLVALLNAWLPVDRRLPGPDPAPPGEVIAVGEPHLLSDADCARLARDGVWSKAR